MYDDRVLASNFVEIMARWMPTFGQQTLIPAPPDDPGSGFRGRNSCRDFALDIADRAAIVELDLLQDLTSHEEVVMRIDHAGQHQCTAGVGHLRAAPG